MSVGRKAGRAALWKSLGSEATRAHEWLPAARREVVRAQWKRVEYVSETASAAAAEGPLTVPGLGAVAGTVKTRGSRAGGAGEAPAEGGLEVGGR